MLKGVIMAGGEGARLRPLTCNRPKPMVPLLGRPMMEYILQLLLKHDLRELAVTLQYLPDQIKDHFGSGEDWGVSLNYFLEKEPLGTAGSVKNAASLLSETFLVISGDCLTDIDLTEAVSFHRRNKALVTIVLTSQENPLEYGVVMTDSSGKITRFLEKPGWGEVFSDTVNTGIYILEPEVLGYIPDGKKYDFSRDLFPLLLAEGKPLYGCVLPGYWCDIGNLEEYMQAQRDMLSGLVTVQIPAREQEKGIWLSQDVEIAQDCRLLPPVFIGPGSRIGAGTTIEEFTVIGAQNNISPGAVVKRGITWEGVSFSSGAALKGGILGKKVHLEEGSVVYEEGVLGDGSVLGKGSVIKPGVKVWPEKRIESGVELRHNLVWGSRAPRSLFGLDGIKGKINAELTPEVIASLGAAFGFMLGKGSRVVLGSAPGAAVQLSKDALKVGLRSAGMEVYELGLANCAMLRLAVTMFSSGGGIYLQAVDGEKDSLSLRFLDSQGLNLSRGDERKLEQLYYRDDFARVDPDAILEEVTVPGMGERYEKHLMQGLNTEAIQKSNFQLVFSCPESMGSNLLISLMGKLECSVVYLPLPQDGTVSARAFARERVRELVKNADADLGAVLSPDGEELFLATADGRLLTDDELQALITLLQLRHRQLDCVAVPVTAPRVHEKLSDRWGGKVVRTSTSPRKRMEGMAGAGLSFLPQAFDSMKTLLGLLDFMASEHKDLEELIQEIPPVFMKEKRVPCAWNQKGRIMRRLVEQTDRDKVEMIEGLKVYEPEGWALVLPDPEEPAYRIIAEGSNRESAGSLADLYMERVRVLQQQ